MPLQWPSSVSSGLWLDRKNATFSSTVARSFGRSPKWIGNWSSGTPTLQSEVWWKVAWARVQLRLRNCVMNRAQRRASSIRPIRNAFCGIRGCYGAYVPSLGFANKSHTGNESVPKIIINDTISLFFRPAILVISNHNIFRVLFDKIATVYLIWKIYLYFSIGNDQPREPALCQLYRHTFIPYCAAD